MKRIMQRGARPGTAGAATAAGVAAVVTGIVACSTAPGDPVQVRLEDGVVQPRDVGTKTIPGGSSNGYPPPVWTFCDPKTDCCVGGGRNFDDNVPFEKQLEDWGCQRPVPWSYDAKRDAWWFYSLCPRTHAALGDLGGVDYQKRTVEPGPLTELVKRRAPRGYSNVPPIWSDYPNERQPCFPPVPGGWTLVTWDPNCDTTCTIDVYQ